MREILSRGKDLETGKWLYGSFVNTPNHTYISTNGEAFPAKVEPKTVGQYTGLTDKNGTKIFEGDIVRYGDTIHKVVFEQRNGTAYFGLVYSPIETLPFGHYQDLRQLEVIGNIYDNPELIGGGENDT